MKYANKSLNLEFIFSMESHFNELSILGSKTNKIYLFNCGTNIKVFLAYIIYLFDVDLLPKSIVNKCIELKVLNLIDGEVVKNPYLSLMNYKVAIKNINENNIRHGHIAFEKLSSDVLFWLKCNIELNKYFRAPIEIRKALREVGLFNQDDSIASQYFDILTLKNSKVIIKTKVSPGKIEEANKRWDEILEWILNYHREQGHLCFSLDFKVKGIKIKDWIINNINFYNKGTLCDERRRKLEESRLIELFKHEIVQSWLDNYNAYKLFIESEQYDGAIKFKTIHNNLPIGKWASLQLKNYKNGKLSDAKIALLKKVNFDFGYEFTGETSEKKEAWLEGIEKLKEYKNEYGCINMPFGYTVDGFELGRWIYYQRRTYKEGKVSKQRFQLFVELGFDDETTMPKSKDGTPYTNFVSFTKELRWNKYYDAFKQFKSIHGHIRIPQHYYMDGLNLYRWKKLQINEYDKGFLSDDKIKKLKEIGFKFKIIDAKLQDEIWNKSYEKLLVFYSIHNHTNVPVSYLLDGVKLGLWVKKQIKVNESSELSEERYDLLNKVGVFNSYNEKLNTRDLYWYENYLQLVKYKKDKGLENKPLDYFLDDLTLDSWMASQRNMYYRKMLLDYRLEKLKEIGFTFNKPKKPKKNPTA